MTELSLPARFEGVEMIQRVRIPARLAYEFTAGVATSRFLRQVVRKRLVGERCPVCTKVYVPPRGACPTCGVATAEQVELGHTGTITSYCIVNVAFYGQAMDLPYVSALVLLDGSDLPIMHLIGEVPYDEVHMGMRVEAVWEDGDEMEPTLEAIRYFRPTGEPDADPATYGEHV